MSGSPKYSFASAQEATARRLREEREARERAEAARRAEEARARAEARRVEVIDQLVEQADGLGMAVAETRAAGGRFLPPGEVAEVERQLRQAVADGRAATDVDAAQAAARRVSSLTLRFGQLRSAAAATAARATAVGRQLATLHDDIDRAAGSPESVYLPAGTAAGWRRRADACRERADRANTADDVRAAEAEAAELGDQVRADAQGAREAREAVANARTTAAALQRAVRELFAGDTASFVAVADRERLTAAAADLTARAQAAADREGGLAVARAVAATDADRGRVASAASAAKLSAHLAEEERTAAALRGELAGLTAERSAKFDPTGRATVQGRLDRAATHLSARQLEPARSELAAARNDLDAHARLVGERFAVWQQARDAARTAVASARGRMTAAAQDPTRQRWVSPQLVALGKRLDKADQLVAGEQFTQAAADATEAEAEVTVLVAKAERLQAAWQLTEQVRAALAADAAGRRHDEGGAAQTEQAVTAAQGLLRSGDADAGERQASAAAAAFARHQERVRSEAERWERERDEAVAEVEKARAHLLDLRGRESVGRWAEARLVELLADLDKAATAAAAGNFATAKSSASAARAAGDRAAAGAAADAQKADLQVYIADGIERSLAALGYDRVVRGAERPDDPRSPIILQAGRSLSPDAVFVTVEFSGRLEYDIGDHQKKVERVDGAEVKTCDDAEDLIGRMHEELLKLGVETTPLEWDDKPDLDQKMKLEQTRGKGNTAPPRVANPRSTALPH